MQTQLQVIHSGFCGSSCENAQPQHPENQIRGLRKNHIPFPGANVLFLVKIHNVTVNVKAMGLTVLLAVHYWLHFNNGGLKSVPSTFRKGTHILYLKKKNRHGIAQQNCHYR